MTRWIVGAVVLFVAALASGIVGLVRDADGPSTATASPSAQPVAIAMRAATTMKLSPAPPPTVKAAVVFGEPTITPAQRKQMKAYASYRRKMIDSQVAAEVRADRSARKAANARKRAKARAKAAAKALAAARVRARSAAAVQPIVTPRAAATPAVTPRASAPAAAKPTPKATPTPTPKSSPAPSSSSCEFPPC